MLNPAGKAKHGAVMLFGFSLLVSSQASAAQAVAATEPSKKPSESEVIFLSADGEPLPPEQQEELRRKYADQLPKRPPAVSEDSPKPERATEPPAIMVTGEKIRGAIVGEAMPLEIYTPLEIQAYGAGDIGELIDSLKPDVSSSRGQFDAPPIVLLNGNRVASFAQIARIPTEAIERLEIFPEELALRYGLRADQKVVNIVTFERFGSDIGQASLALPSAGAQTERKISANLLRIRKDSRLTLNAGYTISGQIVESERDILPPQSMPDDRAFRTLIPRTRRLELESSIAGNWIHGIDSSIYGRFQQIRMGSLLGRAIDPIGQSTYVQDGALGVALGGARANWLWSFTGNIEHNKTRTETDAPLRQGAADIGSSGNTQARADMLVSGSILSTPSGPVSTSVRFGIEQNNLDSIAAQSLGGAHWRTERTQLFARMNLNLPLIADTGGSRRTVLSATGNFMLENLSDFGSLRSFSLGLDWTPSDKMNIAASFVDEDGAPTLEQLGNPLIRTINSRIYDFSKGEFVPVERIFGGNPSLALRNRRQFRFGMALKPLKRAGLTLTLNYNRTRTNNPVVQLAFLSTETESIFPDRFDRLPDGTLIRADARPVNFRRSDQELVQWGVNFTPRTADMAGAKTRFFSDEADMKSKLPPGAIVQSFAAGSPEVKEFEQANGRLIISMIHTIRLRDTLTAPDGVTKLDLLNGFGTGPRGGSPRHSVRLDSTYFMNGIGVQLSASWNSGSIVRSNAASTQDSLNDLKFSSYFALNFGAFVNLGDRFSSVSNLPLLGKARLTFDVTNILDADVRVTDRSGRVPYNYQPDYLDPIGRTITLGIRTKF